MEVNKILSEIPSSEGWKVVEEIKYGWSDDRKFYVETEDGQKLLVRLMPINYEDTYEYTKIQYNFIKECNKLDINVCKAIDFGKITDEPYLYMILSYVDGEQLQKILPSLANERQYECGCQAGRSLRKIHDLDYGQKFDSRTELVLFVDRKDSQLDRYIKSDLRFENDEEIIEFVRLNLPQVLERPTTFLHGDYHSGNLIYTPEEKIAIIDFNRSEVGDPYEDFYKLEGFLESKPFTRGLIDSYFESENIIPEEFWKMFKLYNLHSALCAIIWASQFTDNDLENMKIRSKRVLEDYEHGKLLIPSWYERKG